jgi:hypothetical protein
MGGALRVLSSETRSNGTGLDAAVRSLDALPQGGQDIAAGDPTAQVLPVPRQDGQPGASVQGELTQRLPKGLILEQLLRVPRGLDHSTQPLQLLDA